MTRATAYGTDEELDAMLNEGWAAVEAEQGSDSQYVGRCPDCESRTIAEGGCERCIDRSCGWSRCG